ncbi:amino acid ABC transporter permease [Amycolatopsis jejuensis]|uniref:amino acid ABC transporter permease n=1 Tax=Amycolatopsis jejuensis TaxID=330084 RepID=UPI000527824B|nr:amino acid ABC transporter permease [Amycolatopsis jejuensis]
MTASSIRGGPPAETAEHPAPRVRVRRRYGQWLAAAVAILLFGLLITSLYRNENLGVPLIREYLFNDQIVRGVLITLVLTVVSFVIGLLLGLVVAVMYLSGNRVLSTGARLYVWFFRSVPPLVQLIFWGFFAVLYPQIVLGVPFTSINFVEVDTNSVLTPFIAAIIGLTLIEAAYTAEVFRAGILSVDPGQGRAARALGMKRSAVFRKVVFPQAMPAIIPPTGNNLINLLKGTSLVSIIGGAELMTAAQHIYGQNYQVIPLLTVAALWYLAITSVMSFAQSKIEKHYAKSTRSLQVVPRSAL